MENYKFAIFYGDENKKKEMQDGKVEKFGNILLEDFNHIHYLIEYIDNNFSDIPLFKSLNKRHSPEIAAFLISRLGNIVFLNVTQNIKRFGKSGIFVMPDKITEKQKTTLYYFLEEIKDFSITIIYKLKIVDGILDGDNLVQGDKDNSKNLLDSFFSKLSENEKNKTNK